MYNPRFPHTLRVLRGRLDANGDPVTDNNGEPIEDAVLLQLVRMDANGPIKNDDGSFVTTDSDTINFGYRTSTENTKQYGAVVLSDYKTAEPMFLTKINPGDIVEVTDFTGTFRGVVVKATTFNLGSNIWFNDIKN